LDPDPGTPKCVFNSDPDPKPCLSPIKSRPDLLTQIVSCLQGVIHDGAVVGVVAAGPQIGQLEVEAGQLGLQALAAHL